MNNGILRAQGQNRNPQAEILKEAFSYATGIFTLAAGGSSTQNIQIESNSNFVAIKGMYWCEENGAAAQPTVSTLPAPNLLVELIDTGSNNRLTNTPVPINTLFGTGSRPFVWPVPRVLPANSTLQVVVTNASAATQYNNIQLVFCGFKQFYQG